MSDWTAGYVAEIDYLYGCYHELNPLRAGLALLNVGIDSPPIATACELGFGQGVSVNMHAASSRVQWHGTDFNPAHAAFARDLAGASGAGALLRDEAFAEFCVRADLPDFDYIGLHGVWSWISDENRGVLVDFLTRKLKPGGVLYISYNCLPGWAPMLPMRHMLAEHAERMSTTGQPIASRIDAAMKFMDRLLEAGSAYAKAQPRSVARLETMKTQSRSYLAHEYFNGEWKPVHFAAMAESLAQAKLSYACSAQYFDHFDFLNLTNAQRDLLREIPDPCFRQSVRDFMLGQQFRRDYWVKGPRRLDRAAQIDKVREIRIVLTQPRADIALAAPGALGSTALDAATYAPILDVMQDGQPRTLGAIEAATGRNAPGFGHLVQVAMVLVGKGAAAPAQSDESAEAARPQTERLNAHLLERARTSWDIAWLASPLTGGGISVDRIEQLFLHAERRGLPASAWPGFVSDLFARNDERIKKGDQPLDPAALAAELSSRAEKFSAATLPLLQHLMIG